MNNIWTDLQLREALLAELTALRCIKSAVYYEEGNPGKAISYDIFATPDPNHSSEKIPQTNQHGFISIRNGLFEG
jgi:hypothetical protein